VFQERFDWGPVYYVLTRGLFGSLLALSGITGNLNVALAAAAILVLSFVVGATNRLLGAPEPD
jgi:hypothetical protein